MAFFKSLGRFGGDLLGYRQERKARRAAEDQANIGRELVGQTAGLRSGGVGLLEAILKGETPTALNTFAPSRTAIEDAFGAARENILSSAPVRGGQLNEALINNEFGKAREIGSLDATLRQMLIGSALGIGFQTPGLALQGLRSGGEQSFQFAKFQQDRSKEIGRAIAMAMAAGG